MANRRVGEGRRRVGGLLVAEALAILAVGWRLFGLGREEAALHTYVFELLLYLALFSILSIRERGWFWESAPSTVLVAALVADGVLGSLFGTVGMLGLRPIPLSQTLTALTGAVLSALFVNDCAKRLLLRRFVDRPMLEQQPGRIDVRKQGVEGG